MSNYSLRINFFNNNFCKGKIVNIEFKSVEERYVKVLLPNYNNFEGLISHSDLKKARRINPKKEAKIGKKSYAEILDYIEQKNILSLTKKFIDKKDISILENINKNNNGIYIFINKICYKHKIDINIVWEEIIYKILDYETNNSEEDEINKKYPIDILEVIRKYNLLDAEFLKLSLSKFNKDFIQDFLNIKYELLTKEITITSIFGLATQNSINDIKNIFEKVFFGKDNEYIEKYKIIYCSFPSDSSFNNANYKIEIKSKNIDHDLCEMNNIVENIKINKLSGCFFKLFQEPTVKE